MVRKYIVAWCAYGEWKSSMPFDTEKAAQNHIERNLTSGTFNGDKSHYKNKQVIPVDFGDTID